MKLLSKMRILPLLIVVAMLAFSVRLVDFAAGVSSLSGAALAEEDIAAADFEPAPDQAGLAAPSDDVSESGEALQIAQAEDSDEPPALIINEEELPDTDVWQDPVYDGSGFSQATRDVLDDLGERRRSLEQRERELATREALLQAAEQELERKFEEMSNLRAEIEGLLEQQSEEEAARIQSLVKIYEGMKPKEAARIFDTLDLDVLTSVLSRMSERRLSPILANMNPERARTVTILLAEEKQLPEFPQSN